MKRLLLLLIVVLLAGCESSVDVVEEPFPAQNEMEAEILENEIEELVLTEVEGVYPSEVIFSRTLLDEEFIQRLTSSGNLVHIPSSISWLLSKRIVVVYDDLYFERYPPDYFGVTVELSKGEVFNGFHNGKYITLIYPQDLHTLESLTRSIKQELFTTSGIFQIDDYYNLSGTVVLLDSKIAPYENLFFDKLDSKTVISQSSSLNINAFENVVFVYIDNPPSVLLKQEPPTLPNINEVSSFKNRRGQNITSVSISELFSELYIDAFLNDFGITTSGRQEIVLSEPLLSIQGLEEYRLGPEICKISNSSFGENNSGFPISSDRINSLGNVKAKVVYIDFNDYRLGESGDTLEERYLEIGDYVNHYFQTMSYGKISFDWDIHPEPVLMPKGVREYELNREDARPGYYPTLNIVYEMLRLHRDSIDFSDTELIVVMFNPNVPFALSNVSPAHPVGQGNPFITNQGNIYNAVTIGSDWRDYEWQKVAHEIGHTLGLIDLYDYEPQADWNDYHRFVGGFDIMGAINQQNIELLGWNRYLLDWVRDEQVFCMNAPETSITIPIQSIDKTISGIDELQMVVIPLENEKVLVIEAKQKNPFCQTCNGLLVYTVDTRIANGRGSIQVIPIDRSRDIMKNDAMIRVGESLLTHSIHISLISASPNGYVVEINQRS